MHGCGHNVHTIFYMVPHLYCIGDANGKMMLAYAASAQFSVVEQVSGKDHLLNHLSIPAACFTHPEIKYGWTHRASGDGSKWATIIGDVYVRPSAKIHPTAKIGPNVSISANVRIAAGVRLISCIILDDVEIKENAVVMHAIVGRKSPIGKWSRAQAEGDYNAKLGITILGEAVTVEDEVVVTNSIVLPNKTLNVSVQEDIIL